jgi:hypothetical protein
VSHPTHSVLPMATSPEPHSAHFLSQFFEVAELEPAVISDLVERLATDHWETTPQWYSLFWPLLTTNHNLDSNVDNIAAPVIRLQPGTDDIQELREVVLTVVTSSELAIEVAEPSVYWDGPGTPIAVRLQEGAVLIERSSPTFADEFIAAIEVVSARRHSRFVVCPECGESNPPEHRMSNGICHGCAQRNHGVVFCRMRDTRDAEPRTPPPQ